MSIGMGNFMKLDVLFCLCYPIFLNNFLDDMVCMINDFAIVTFHNDDIEDLELGTFLECLVK